MNERGWKDYCARVRQFRLEFNMRSQIQTLDQAAAPRPRRPHGKEFAAGAAGAAAAAGGAGGAAGGGAEGAQTLGAMGGEQQDEAYEAFVTSERVPVGSFLQHTDYVHLLVAGWLRLRLGHVCLPVTAARAFNQCCMPA
jgi:hypothetical protein